MPWNRRAVSWATVISVGIAGAGSIVLPGSAATAVTNDCTNGTGSQMLT